MKLNFEENLEIYSDRAKRQSELESEQDYKGISTLNNQLQGIFDVLADEQGTPKSVQEDIYTLQKKKQLIMDSLKEQLEIVDDEERDFEIDEDKTLLKYNSEDDSFYYINKNNNREKVTRGEMMTDMEWGLEYQLDKKSTPRHILKKYLVSLAKHKILGLLNRQIVLNEFNTNQEDISKRMAYGHLEDDINEERYERRLGHIAEAMVKNILQKISIDYDMPFEVIDADVFQDVDRKIDFIIRKKERSRGVVVENLETHHDVGIQFTLNKGAIRSKRAQIQKALARLRPEERIDDIILVSFSFKQAQKLFKRWEKDGKKVGGPDKLISEQIIKMIFRRTLEGIFEEGEVEEFWERIKNDNKFGAAA